MPKELEKNLILRNGKVKDLPAIIEHIRRVHGEEVIDLVRGMYEKNPRFEWKDVFLVEDKTSGEIAAHLILLKGSWTLDGIEFPSVQMEVVGTLDNYRGRGLIKKLNDEYEKRVKEISPTIMVIAGIPQFYKRFGYEFAAQLGGGIFVAPALIPKLSENEEERVSIKEVDIETFREFLEFREKRLPKSTWLQTLRVEDYEYHSMHVTDPAHEAMSFYLAKKRRKTVGCFFINRWESRIDVGELYLENHTLLVPILHYVNSKSKQWNGLPFRVIPPSQTQVEEFLYAITRNSLAPRYAWYVKIPSLTRFFDNMGSILSERLLRTEWRGFTGELTFTNYKEGYGIMFGRGKFKALREIPDKKIESFDLRAPTPSLTRLLMGYETFDELSSHEPDVQCRFVMRPLVRALFPKLDAKVDPFY
ncbi:MAG: GNAT family N-acetyltransferase [Candidatus Thorarchaeota archaeon]|nr:GNAT family N-acetyltransferase [Candidatus Thorarchaeota archaeon]